MTVIGQTYSPVATIGKTKAETMDEKVKLQKEIEKEADYLSGDRFTDSNQVKA